MINQPQLDENKLIQFEPVTAEELIDIVRNLKSKASVGYDSISTIMIQNVITELGNTLVILINKYMKDGIFPDELKIAKVTTIYKSGSRDGPSNYRSLSILPIFSKIFETIIYKRLVTYLAKINFIHPHQFGFQKHSNTTAACIQLIENLYELINNKMKTAAVFIDVRKAFDSVNQCKSHDSNK